jgi:hypothetical protein
MASGGVMTSSSPAHFVAATVGQVIVGLQAGSPYRILAGFWNPALEGPSRVPDSFPVLPASFRLDANCPNPFSEWTTLLYAVPRSCHLALKVYDVQGRLVCPLENGLAAPGLYASRWDGRDLAGRSVGSGVYVARLSAAAMGRPVHEINHAILLIR